MRRRTRIVLVAAVSAVVLAGAGIVAFSGSGSSDKGYDTHASSFVLPQLEGSGKVSLAALSGKPIIVNFFASWCTACAGELPLLAREAKAWRGKIDVVEVDALETGDGTSFANKYHLPSSVTAVARDVGGGNGDGLYHSLGGSNSMPLTAFYNAQGKVLFTHPGAFQSASELKGYLHQFKIKA